VNKLENRSGKGRWLKGQTGNAARCPTNARTRIPGELLPNPQPPPLKRMESQFWAFGGN
jgi:hypothetical protein